MSSPLRAVLPAPSGPVPDAVRPPSRRAPRPSEKRATPRSGTEIPATELGNAERLVAQHGDRIRYCVPTKTWYVWDGRRWAVDEMSEIERMAKATVRSIYQEAERASDNARRKELALHAVHSERATRIEAMIALARSDERVVVRPIELDADPLQLNAANGTIDLRSGELHPHRAGDLITKLAPQPFDPESRSERWQRYLDDTFGRDSELLAFVQRLVGYSITGTTSEEILVAALGPGATGKTTFVETMKATLGDYAATTDFETFLAKREAGVRNDIARLVGKRFVAGVEVERGRHLAEALLKLLTGGDTVSARQLYHEYFEFRPTAKLWLVANDRPHVGDDDAIWRRIRVVPFSHVVPKARRDPALKVALRDDPDERSAVLAWAVQGCLLWRRDGLGSAPAIDDATAAYRESTDPIAAFLEERCVIERDASVGAGELYAAYTAYAKGAGERPITSTDFGRRLGARGLESAKGGRGLRLRVGIRLEAQTRFAEDER